MSESETMRKELTEALGTLLDLIQLTRILDKAKLSSKDTKDFTWAKNIHAKYSYGAPAFSAPPDPSALDRAEFDLRETLRAVLHFFGPDGANKVTGHVMMARRSRDSNAEIDEIERMLEAEELRRLGAKEE